MKINQGIQVLLLKRGQNNTQKRKANNTEINTIIYILFTTYQKEEEKWAWTGTLFLP